MLRYLAGITSSHCVDSEMVLDTKPATRWTSRRAGLRNENEGKVGEVGGGDGSGGGGGGGRKGA